MPDLSNYAESKLVDHMVGTTSWTMPATPRWSLHAGHPGETGANELTGGSYARQTIAFGAASGGVATNSGLITWDLTGVTGGTVTHFGLWDALTVGNFIVSAPLTATPFTFTALASTDVYTSYGHTLANDNRVEVKAFPGSALPTGIAEDTIYFVVGIATDTFQLSATQGGAAVNLSANGEGIAVLIAARTFSPGDQFQVAAGQLSVTAA